MSRLIARLDWPSSVFITFISPVADPSPFESCRRGSGVMWCQNGARTDVPVWEMPPAERLSCRTFHGHHTLGFRPPGRCQQWWSGEKHSGMRLSIHGSLPVIPDCRCNSSSKRRTQDTDLAAREGGGRKGGTKSAAATYSITDPAPLSAV